MAVEDQAPFTRAPFIDALCSALEEALPELDTEDRENAAAWIAHRLQPIPVTDRIWSVTLP